MTNEKPPYSFGGSGNNQRQSDEACKGISDRSMEFHFVTNKGNPLKVILSGEGLGDLKLNEINALEQSFTKFGHEMTNFFIR